MAMTVRNDSGSMMALGQLKKNDSSLSKQLKKVSSGMRLNSAEDDASGYSVSERMRVMIRSLGQDIQNTQTGKNLVATAEGGMQEIINNLRSMKELAINSANDHNTDLDRETLEKEFASRKEAITDITASTNYNGRLLLTGDYAQYRIGAASSPISSSVTMISDFQPAFNSCSSDWKPTLKSGSGVLVDSSFVGFLGPPRNWNYWTETGQTKPSGTMQEKQIAVSLDFSSLNSLNIDFPSSLDGKGFSILCADCPQYIDIVFDASTTTASYTPYAITASGRRNYLSRVYTIGVQNVTKATDIAKAVFDGIKSVQSQITIQHARYVPSNPIDTNASNILIDSAHYLRMAEINGSYYFLKEDDKHAIQFLNGLFDGPKNEFYRSEDLTGTPLIIHTGPKANQNVRVFINAMWPKNMGIEDSHVTPIEAALMAMGALDKAVDYALNEITRMGAYQMRLGQTEANLVTNEENTQAAESTIRDADMAREMTGYTKASILSQSAQAMLAQANQNSSNVLSLLQ
ncbi:Flagellin FlgL [Selenomonas ruminantium]|uniref:Flagellin n=1 Tax=Selenomonas ruminantium TaxID=971 RepID=A0A1M6UNG4_SELRU|nr:flagellin [Selenomonas ruminantium]SHK70653.1 Flagellin FlgL [Selenomonas ruminantium]